MVRILLTDYYPLNKGVVAILTTALDSLKKEIQNVEFTVLSFHLESTHCDTKVLGWLIKKENFLRIIRNVVIDFLYALSYRKNKDIASFIIKGVDAKRREILQEYAKADLVISVGGSLDISSGYTFGGIFALFPHFYSTFLSKLLCKPVMMYAYTVLPAKGFGLRDKIFKFLVKLVWNRVDLVTVRDENSKKNLDKLGVKTPKICVTADPAVLLTPETNQERMDKILRDEKITKDRPLVGITLAHFPTRYSVSYHYHGSSDPFAQYTMYKVILGRVADFLVKKYNAIVVFIPVELNLKGCPTNDRPLIFEVMRMIRNKTSVRVIAGEYTPQELKGLLGQMDMLIGTKLHSIIFAAPMLVPTIGIAYEPKVDAFMQRLGQERWVCDLLDITSEDLISKINELWVKRDDVREHLKVYVEILQKHALMNARFARNLLFQ